MMRHIWINNRRGLRLSAKIIAPDRNVRAWCLLAHCFTCGMNLAPYLRIGRTLTDHGLGLMRFDMTGLGDSQGNFADTNFRTSVEDVLDVAAFMQQQGRGPDFLIGHSQGGSAAVAAATKLPQVAGVVTMASLAETRRTLDKLNIRPEELQRDGRAVIDVVGRQFTIKPHFVEALRTFSLREHLQKLNRPLLVIHGTDDHTVPLQEAYELFGEAREPKSMITVPGANHLLTNNGDAEYVGNLIAAWAERFIRD